MNENVCFTEHTEQTCLLKFNNINTGKRCGIYSKFAIKTPERRQEHFGVFIVNSELFSYLFVVFLLMTLSMYFFA